MKTSEGYRELGGDSPNLHFATLAGEFLQDVRQAQNQVVLKTAPGHASSVAVALDDEAWSEIVGTIAGDDTILVICSDTGTAETVRSRLMHLLGRRAVPPLLLVTGMLAVVIGVPFGLYAFFTSDQRRTTRDVKAASAARGWRYSKQRWQGNPAAFRIEGKTANGTAWVLTSGNTSMGADRGWSVQLTLRFPTLGGEPDFAIEPREIPRLPVPAGIEGSEAPSGLTAFDAVYRVTVLPRNITQPLSPRRLPNEYSNGQRTRSDLIQ